LVVRGASDKIHAMSHPRGTEAARPSPPTVELTQSPPVRHGAGAVVVATHGFADDASTFEPLVAELAGGYRVVTWDLPGHGRSPAGSRPATRASALTGLEGAVGAAGPGPVSLIGHSLGGYLSLCHTVLSPASVSALVLISCGPGFRDPAKRTTWNQRMVGFARERGVPTAAAGIAEQPDSLALDALASVTTPTLIIVGSKDRAYHRGSELMAEELPDATLLVIHGAGHFPHQTHVTETAQAIDGHFARVGTGRPPDGAPRSVRS
jgi:pimeloyl-ACP methyl ester carboxylesterase